MDQNTKTMKTLLNLTFICIAAFFFVTLSSQTGKSENVAVKSSLDTSSSYADGIYEGHSQSYYTSEPFWGHIKITVSNGSFTEVQFKIRDSLTHENVDSVYGVIHYSGIPEYMDQCVHEEHGIETYPQLLLETQDVDDIDGITHETWSYNIFVASANKALDEGARPDGIHHSTSLERVLVEAIPNPFNSTLTFRYRLPHKTFVNLTIYNQQGKLINNLISKEQTAGNYLVEWDTCPSAGVYYFRLQTEYAVLCSKVIRVVK
jgi:major membrane immunogen (membrane-anchored lipoprotein)